MPQLFRVPQSVLPSASQIEHTGVICSQICDIGTKGQTRQFYEWDRVLYDLQKLNKIFRIGCHTQPRL